MWGDLQETAYIVLGPFLVYLLLPVWVAIGLLIAVIKAIQKLFKGGWSR